MKIAGFFDDFCCFVSKKPTGYYKRYYLEPVGFLVWPMKTIHYDFLLRFRIIISKNPASQDKISLNDKFWSGTVFDFPDENKNL